MSDRHSFDLKLDRAEEHLIDLERKVRDYCDSDPYEVRAGRKTKNKARAWYLHFTRQPDEAIALIAGDFVNNVRAADDHIATSLVANKYLRDVHFPIFWQEVWRIDSNVTILAGGPIGICGASTRGKCPQGL